MSTGLWSLILSLLGLFGAGWFWNRRAAKKAEKRADDADARADAIQQSQGRDTAIHKVKEILDRKAEEQRTKTAAKLGADSALADERLAQVDAARDKGAQAVSDLANQRILAARAKAQAAVQAAADSAQKRGTK